MIRIIFTLLIIFLVVFMIHSNIFSTNMNEFFEKDRLFYTSNFKSSIIVFKVYMINTKHFFLLLFKGNWKAALGIILITTFGMKVITLTLIGNIRTHFDINKDIDESKIPDSQKSKYINKMKQIDINESVNDILSEAIHHYDTMVTKIASSVIN